MDDFDVDDFGSGKNFIRKEDLKTDGPQRKRIQTVEQRESRFDKDKAGKPGRELVLVFSDGTCFGLRAQVNRDEMKTAYGKRTSLWVGKLVEVYCDPSVRNPQGAKVGGVRLRIPAEDGGPEEYVSDLEEGYEEDEAAPPVPAKARH